MLQYQDDLYRSQVANNKQPSDSRHSEKVSNTISRVTTFSSISSSITSNASRGDHVSRSRNTGVVRGRCNKTEHPISKSISGFSFSSSREGCKSPSRNKLETAHSVCAFRNGERLFLLKKLFKKEDYMNFF